MNFITIQIIKIVLYMILLFIRLYALLFLSVNFYYLRDNVKIIYNPKSLIAHIRQILKSVM